MDKEKREKMNKKAMEEDAKILKTLEKSKEFFKWRKQDLEKIFSQMQNMEETSTVVQGRVDSIMGGLLDIQKLMAETFVAGFISFYEDIEEIYEMTIHTFRITKFNSQHIENILTDLSKIPEIKGTHKDKIDELESRIQAYDSVFEKMKKYFETLPQQKEVPEEMFR